MGDPSGGFRHVPHPHVAQRRRQGPVKTADQHGEGVNARVALWITTHVGTMVAAYAFCAIALVGAVAIVTNNTTLGLVVGLVSQTFLQLVLLPVLQLGQNILAAAADKRAEQTWSDVEAILHELHQVHEHLEAVRDATGS